MIVSMPPNDAYRENFDRIFGKRPIKHGERTTVGFSVAVEGGEEAVKKFLGKLPEGREKQK